MIPNADRHIAACIEIAALNGDPGAPRNGPLRWMDMSEVGSLEMKKKKKTYIHSLHLEIENSAKDASYTFNGIDTVYTLTEHVI